MANVIPGQWGYYAVTNQKGEAGVLFVPPNQRPTSVGGSAVTHLAYLGDTNTPKSQLTSNLQQFAGSSAQGLFEYGGGLSGLINDATSAIDHASTSSASPLVWMKPGSGGISSDILPTAVLATTVAVLAAPAVGLGALGAEGITAAEGGTEAGAGTAATAAGGVGTGAAGGGVASKLTSAATNAAKSAAPTLAKAATALSLTALFTNIGLWKGIGMVFAGAVLVLIGIMNLAGVDAGGIGKTAARVIK